MIARQKMKMDQEDICIYIYLGGHSFEWTLGIAKEDRGEDLDEDEDRHDEKVRNKQQYIDRDKYLYKW